jgi:hypothetical protein
MLRLAWPGQHRHGTWAVACADATKDADVGATRYNGMEAPGTAQLGLDTRAGTRGLPGLTAGAPSARHDDQEPLQAGLGGSAETIS